MEAREIIQKEKAKGEELVARLKAARQITAGFYWKEGSNHLGKDLFEICKKKHLKKKTEEREKKQAKGRENLLRIETAS